MQQLPSLTRLDLRGASLTDEDLLELVQAVPHLTALGLAECSELSRLSLDHINRHLTQLKEIDLSYNFSDFPPVILENLWIYLTAELPQLSYLQFYPAGTSGQLYGGRR